MVGGGGDAASTGTVVGAAIVGAPVVGAVDMPCDGDELAAACACLEEAVGIPSSKRKSKVVSRGGKGAGGRGDGENTGLGAGGGRAVTLKSDFAPSRSTVVGTRLPRSPSSTLSLETSG